jgi:hypothetical protein
LNHIVIDVRLNTSGGWTNTGAPPSQKAQQGDLVVFDRSIPSYDLFASIIHQDKSDFLMRIRKNSFKDTAYLFDSSWARATADWMDC